MAALQTKPIAGPLANFEFCEQAERGPRTFRKIRGSQAFCRSRIDAYPDIVADMRNIAGWPAALARGFCLVILFATTIAAARTVRRREGSTMRIAPVGRRAFARSSTAAAAGGRDYQA
jgi:hypothetical protein